MDFLELAKKRYSVRDFSSKKVEKEKILKMENAVAIKDRIQVMPSMFPISR